MIDIILLLTGFVELAYTYYYIVTLTLLVQTIKYLTDCKEKLYLERNMFFSEIEPHAICRNKIEFPTIDHECVLVHAKMIFGSLFSSAQLRKSMNLHIKYKYISMLL